MIDIQGCLWLFSLIPLLLCFIHGLKKKISMAIALTSPHNRPPSSSSSPLLPQSPPPPWRLGLLFLEDQALERKKRGLSIPKEEEKEKNENCIVLSTETRVEKVGEARPPKIRKRPARLTVPEYCPGEGFVKEEKKIESNNEYIEVEGMNFFVVSKKGRRTTMEDGYGVMLDILGDPKQAFFVVIDGHGGRAAADYVADHLGRNIVKELERVEAAGDGVEAALRGGFSITDKGFLIQGLMGGACAAGVLLKDGEVNTSNAGDCRIVMSRNGAAFTLTNDHRLSREDERSRIENSGGFVHCHNGVWRVNGSLAVSRAIGDLSLKDWVISEPEIQRIHLTSDCNFLIMASDGLWDKVNDQEAVDVVARSKCSIESCKKLVDLSSSRGNIDDITVMVINLQKFCS